MIIMNTIKTSASVNNTVKNISANFKPFNLDEAKKKGVQVVTRDGKKAKVICETRGKLLVTVFGKVSYETRQYKYNLDGSRFSSNLIHNLDLMIKEEAA